jgi:hypothetical protein
MLSRRSSLLTAVMAGGETLYSSMGSGSRTAKATMRLRISAGRSRKRKGVAMVCAWVCVCRLCGFVCGGYVCCVVLCVCVCVCLCMPEDTTIAIQTGEQKATTLSLPSNSLA